MGAVHRAPTSRCPNCIDRSLAGRSSGGDGGRRKRAIGCVAPFSPPGVRTLAATHRLAQWRAGLPLFSSGAGEPARAVAQPCVVQAQKELFLNEVQICCCSLSSREKRPTLQPNLQRVQLISSQHRRAVHSKVAKIRWRPGNRNNGFLQHRSKGCAYSTGMHRSTDGMTTVGQWHRRSHRRTEGPRSTRKRVRPLAQ